MKLEQVNAPFNEAARPHSGAWPAVVVLSAMYLLSVFDRQIIAILARAIRSDLRLGDIQMGVLLGLAFASSYVVFGLPFGWLSDRWPRRLMIASGVAVWSASTLSIGLANTFTEAVFCRIGTGFGEAALMPAAYSLIADLFPGKRVGLPLSLFALGAPIGAGLSLLIGGPALDMARASHIHSVLGRPVFAWQLVMLLTGVPGVVMTLLALSLPEPRRKDFVYEKKSGGSLISQRKTWLYTVVLLAFGLGSLIGATTSSWAPLYMGQKFGWSTTHIGLLFGTITIFATAGSNAISGWTINVLSKRGIYNAPIRIYLVMACIAFPFSIMAFLTNTPWIFLVSLFAICALLLPNVGLGSTTIQTTTPPPSRGLMSGTYMTVTSLMGYGGGPLLVGWISQAHGNLGLALAGVLAVTTGLVIVGLIFALRPVSEAARLLDAKDEGIPAWASQDAVRDIAT